MNKPLLLAFFLCSILFLKGQNFIRTELPTTLNKPWEISYGPDNFLYLTEAGGVVSRVNPLDGQKTVIYTAPDYFEGSELERWPHCHQPNIRHATLGLTLHPEFTNPNKAYIYFVYAYNAGNTESPKTNFRIKRLTWHAQSESIIGDSNIVNGLPSSYDHMGGRLIIAPLENENYLFLSIGDHGISEQNSPDCYPNQALNPNNFTQDPDSINGKIHRFNLDGSIPLDNPIPGNSFFTRGHRNPQGLMFNPRINALYNIEHGDRTDDEINRLIKGMNYGWKQVRGYHFDESYDGEKEFVQQYHPHPNISQDQLIEPLYAWCNEQDSSNNYLDWCTVAPSDGIYYGSPTIPEWENSLLVVTLKDGQSTDRELYQFQLNEEGILVESEPSNPNPKRFFADDQALNGRLRDLCYSPDGSQLFLINNGGTDRDKITVYTYQGNSVEQLNHSVTLGIFPNPAKKNLTISGISNAHSNSMRVVCRNVSGQIVKLPQPINRQIDLSNLKTGYYLLEIAIEKQRHSFKLLVQ